MFSGKRSLLLVCVAALAFAAFFVPGGAARRALGAAGDTDDDGLPDAWEIQYFGNLAQNDIGDPDGDGYSNLAEYNNGTNPAAAETMPPYISTLAWEPVGPGGGGAQYNPAIAPNNPDLMYGFCDMGGVYRSQDGGRNWQMYTFDQAQMPVAYSPVHCNPQFDPFDENICFIGVQGALKRTTDGGDTWEAVASGVDPTAIAIDRAHTNIVWFADNTNTMWKSTNGGDTWTEATSWNLTVGLTVMDLFIDASSAIGSLVVYAATENGMFKTVNGGTSWTTANGNLPSTSISDFNAGMQNSLPVLYVAVRDFGVYKSFDGGATWNARNQGFNVADAGHMELGLCDGNPDVVYVGSEENYGPTVYKTIDGGAHWTMVVTDPNASNFPAGVTVERDWMTLALGWGWGGEPHEIEVSGTDPNAVAFSEDGRTFRSSDGGQSWFCCNSRETTLNSNWWPSRGFEVTTNYRVHFAPWDHDFAYITYTDIGFFRSEDHAASWRPSWTGTPYRNTFYDVAFDPTTAGKMWAVSSNNHDLPHEKMLRQAGFLNFTGAVLKSTNYGATWTSTVYPIAANSGAITSIIVDPTSTAGSRTLYCAIMGRGVYKSTNDGATWAAANNGLSMPSNMNAWQLRRMADGTLYCAMTEAMNTSSSRFPGALFKSTDGAGTWTKVNTGQVFPYICGFDVDPTDQNVMYVATFKNAASWGQEGLYRTTNGGTTWTRTLHMGDTYGADIDPELHTRVYATIEQGEDFWPNGGIYMSEDSGVTWTKLPGMPFERYGPNYTNFDPDNSEIIYVTTFGGGVWKTRVLHAEAPAASFTATPESGQFPLDVTFDSSASSGSITTYTWDFDDGTRSHAANPTHTFASAGTYHVTLAVEGMNGKATATATIDAINVDSDGDGLPDWWELQYFGNLDQGAGDDPDGDGSTNIEEYTNGTDPTQADATPPTVSTLAVLPTQVRAGVDAQVALSATATDAATGNSNIVAGEYFVDVLGAEGTGSPMRAADGAFDEALEGLATNVPIGGWALGSVTLYVRARDASGFWSDAESIVVPVVDGNPPSAVRDLAVEPALQFDKVASESWLSVGTPTSETETKTIDLGELKTIGAVSLEPASELALFPKDFTITGSEDLATWTVLGMANGYRALRGTALWMNAPVDYRYIRITATGVRNSRDGLYYVKMADIGVYETTDSNHLRATWHATADDDNTASSGAASEYDLRYSNSLITGTTFDAAAQATSGVPVPGVKGTAEEADFSIGSTAGTVYVALKVGDEVPNWSAISNVASTEVAITGLQPLSPDDAISTNPGILVQFTYQRGVDAKSAAIAFSDRPDFPVKAITNGDGTKSKTLRYRLTNGMTWWRGSASQWKKMKALASNNGTLYWRLEGKSDAYKGIYGPTRSIFFDAGAITDLAITGSHLSGADEAIWPDVAAPPFFQWTNGTAGMRYFFVDVSTDMTIPLPDRTKTARLAGTGVTDHSYKATNAEWKAVRRLAARAGGTLYWRVRALDTDRVFVYGSAVKKLVIDPGTWVLDAIDFGEANPYVHWTHTGDGIAKYRLQFCKDDVFANTPGNVLTIPSSSIAGDSYLMTATEKSRLLAYAARHLVGTLYWRVRGEDADKSFTTVSDPAAAVLP